MFLEVDRIVAMEDFDDDDDEATAGGAAKAGGANVVPSSPTRSMGTAMTATGGAGAGAGAGAVGAGGKKTRRACLVKWRGLSYGECTWEWLDELEERAKVAQYARFNHPPAFSVRGSGSMHRSSLRFHPLTPLHGSRHPSPTDAAPCRV